MQMRESFAWDSAVKVDEQNAEDGTPTLYYAWVHIGSKEDALALKQLYIHVLSRPLFDQELLAYAGRCGTFTNPGGGAGAFVPALIPGATYNALIDALTSGDIEGDPRDPRVGGKPRATHGYTTTGCSDATARLS